MKKNQPVEPTISGYEIEFIDERDGMQIVSDKRGLYGLSCLLVNMQRRSYNGGAISTLNH